MIVFRDHSVAGVPFEGDDGAILRIPAKVFPAIVAGLLDGAGGIAEASWLGTRAAVELTFGRANVADRL